MSTISPHIHTQTSVGAGTGVVMRLQSFYTGATDSRTNGFVLRYNALKKLALSKKDQMHIESQKLIAQEKSIDRKKELLMKARENADVGTLNWQPSYVARKRDTSGMTSGVSRSSLDTSNSIDDFSDPPKRAVQAGCSCAIS